MSFDNFDDWDGDSEDFVDYDPECDDRSDFAEPFGNSALRKATKDNPRNLPCPQCGGEDLLTPKDVQNCYVCDRCADQNERGW